MRVAGVVAYDGSRFRGFQRQADVPTIQGELERGLAACTRSDSTVIGAGRTDSGVHATGQVVATDVEWRHGLAALRRAWNANLPAEVRVCELHAASADFHPRFDALTRTYVYRVLQDEDGEVGDRWPLANGRAWFIPRRLDIQAMNAAAAALLGTRDFGAFGPAPDGGHTVRTLLRATWRADEGTAEALARPSLRQLTFTVTANAFLYRMVRRLVSALTRVGTCRWSLDELRSLLRQAKMATGLPPAPPDGLYLAEVTYDRPLRDLRSN